MRNPYTAQFDPPQLPEGRVDIYVEVHQRDGYLLIWKRAVRELVRRAYTIEEAEFKIVKTSKKRKKRKKPKHKK